MNSAWHQRRTTDRENLRAIVSKYPDPVLLTGTLGNMGDHFMWAGADSALGDLFTSRLDAADLPSSRGDTLVFPGNGAFAPSHHGYIPPLVHMAASRFRNVVILPSTFDVTLEETRDVLRLPNVIPLAREQVSSDAVGCPALLCCSVYAPLPSPTNSGKPLICLRTDAEASYQPAELLHRNRDISATATNLSEWLAIIAASASVVTDRSHVMVAAVLLDKPVRLLEGNYFKNAAMAEFTFGIT